ncbi:hypothetical protein LLG46_05460 [bacterium]|nr:hypothetical protein [bacterium]
MRHRQLTLYIIMAVLASICSEGTTAPSRLEQIQQRKAIIQQYIIPAATKTCGEVDNMPRTEAMLAVETLKYAESLALAEEQVGVTLSAEQDGQVEGTLEQIEPSKYANMLINHIESIRDSKDADSVSRMAAGGQLFEAIRSMPWLVTINGLDLAKRQYKADIKDSREGDITFSKALLDAAKTAASHNDPKGYIPADLLAVFADGYAEGESTYTDGSLCSNPFTID